LKKKKKRKNRFLPPADDRFEEFSAGASLHQLPTTSITIFSFISKPQNSLKMFPTRETEIKLFEE
jgi:hypothetical protein